MVLEFPASRGQGLGVHRSLSFRFACSLLLVGCCASAYAGPPFLTDDPEPVDLHHTEINFAYNGTNAVDGRVGATAIDANFGVASQTQFHVAVPMAFSGPRDGSMRSGLGDAELGVKYRFLDADGGLMAAIYPTVYLPTGDASRGLGNGHAQLLLPIWLQESSGAWVWDGGLTYQVNHAPGARSNWFAGALAQRRFSDEFSLGSEVFYRTAGAVGAKSSVGFNLGATVRLNDDANLLISIGRGLKEVDTNQQSIYVAYQLEL